MLLLIAANVILRLISSSKKIDVHKLGNKNCHIPQGSGTLRQRLTILHILHILFILHILYILHILQIESSDCL